MSYSIIIPARYASTRFPGKPLAMLAGKPMLQHVYECAGQCGVDRIVIATDDERIRASAEGFGAEVCMTRNDHESGTSRLAEVVDTLGMPDESIIVNLQGDEPFMPGSCIQQVAHLLEEDDQCGMSTLCHSLTAREDVDDPHIVKVVLDRQGYALYFSRAPIPWHRDEPSSMQADYLRHIGLYAYRAGFLRRYIEMEATELERTESLEQLRVLWHGEKIRVGITELDAGMGIDTPDDLVRANQLLEVGQP